MGFSMAKSLVAFAAIGISSCASAGTEADYQALRSWCMERDLRQNDVAWQEENNRRYFHFHHFCYAMKVENKLIAPRNQQERKAVVDEIAGQTTYVIGHVPENHLLLPEVYAMRGRAMYVGKRYVEAESALRNALRLDPRHARAASYLASLYLDTNRRSEAVKVVSAGLALTPGDYRLRQLGKELRIELPPERAATGVDSAPQAGSGPSGESAAVKTEALPPDAHARAEGAEQPTDVPAIGCRFCPPDEIQKKWRESFGEKPQ